MTIREGIVKWWNEELGYGFITNPDGKDVFVHYNALPGESGQKNLKGGDTVIYQEEEGDKGLKATAVFKILREVI